MDVSKYKHVFFDNSRQNISILSCLEISSFEMSLRISFLFIFEKENSNPGCLLQYISYSMFEKFLHFKTASVILLVGASKFEYSKILRLLFFQARFTPDKIEQSPQSIKLQKKKKGKKQLRKLFKKKKGAYQVYT